jgi:hypothetical protein
MAPGRHLDRASTPAAHPADVPPPVPRGAALSCGVLVTLACLLLYVRTAARDIVVGDTPELMTVAVTFGVAHPSGYPLLTLLGHLFSLLPFGAVAFRVNLMSAVCGAGTVALAYLTAYWLTRSWPAAALAALALGLNPLFWSWSLVFEAFSLNNLLAASLIALLVLWELRGRDAYLIAAALVSGLALSNHLTIVLLGPATLGLLWRHRDRLLRRPRVVAWCAGALLLGLLPYASIPWAAARHPFLSWGDVRSVSDLVALFLRRDYGTAQLVVPDSEFAGGSPVTRLLALASSFATIEGPLLLAGAVDAYRRQRWYFWFAMLGLLFAGPVYVAHANMDISKDSTLWVLQRFFLLSHVVAAPLTAFGVVMCARLVKGRNAIRVRLVHVAMAAGALAAIVVPAAMGYRAIDQRDNHLATRYAQDVLDTLEPGTLLLANGDEHGSPIAFVQAIEGRRPDVTLVWLGVMRAGWYIRLMQTRHPDLRIPASKAPATLTLRDIVDANQGRPIAVAGGTADKSVEGKYGFIQHGLVSLVKPMTQTFNLVQIAADTDAWLRRYRLPSPESIHRETFEPALLRTYASPAEWVASQYRQAGHKAEAADWYRRALKIDPDFREAQQGLAQVTGKE